MTKLNINTRIQRQMCYYRLHKFTATCAVLNRSEHG